MFKINPFTGKFDDVGNFLGLLSSAPTGVEGAFYLNTSDHKLYIYYSGTWQVLHELSYTPPTPPAAGTPFGLWLPFWRNYN